MWRNIGIAAGLIAALSVWGWVKRRRQMSAHRGLSKEDFIVYFADSGVDAAKLSTVYTEVQRAGDWPTYEPSPDDNLLEFALLVDEELEEFLHRIVPQLGLEMPVSFVLAEWEHPIESVADLVRWIGWLQTKQVEPITGRPLGARRP